MFLRIQCEERISVEQLSDVGYWFDRRMCERAVVASRGRRFVSNKEKINRLTSLSLSLFLSSLPSPLLPSLPSIKFDYIRQMSESNGWIGLRTTRKLSISLSFSLTQHVPRCTALHASQLFVYSLPPSSPLSLQNLELDRHHGETRP